MDDPLAHLLEAGLDVSRDRRYALERELGRGSMGVAYAAHDRLLDRPVAIKVMAASMVGDGELRRYFEREARAAGRLSHRNVVTVHDFGYDRQGAPFVVMELLRGLDLRQITLAGSPLSVDRRLAVVLQVLAGLAHAHSSGVVHRDVKPANVFITDEGVVKLLDFGIARLSRSSRGNSSDAVMGTADYMSPEQVLGGEMDGRSDLFSCGALLFELVAGRPPFHAESFVTIAYRVVHEEPDYAALPAAWVGLEPVLRKALAKSRDDRYASAPDFATDIGLAMGVGVAPETIQPTPAWTSPLPRLMPPKAPPPTVSLREQWEEGAQGSPDLSHVRPGWPLQGPAEDEEPAPRSRRRPRPARLGWTAAALCSAAVAFAVGAARRPALAPHVATVSSIADVPAAPAAAVMAPPTSAPEEEASPLPAVESAPAPATLPAPPSPASRPPSPASRPLPASASSFWSSLSVPSGAAPGPATGSASVLGPIPPAPAPSPQQTVVEAPRILGGRWAGYVTDEFCREKGAVQDHGQCLEVCLRRGRQALIAIDGQLYKLVGIERIRGLHDRRVVVEGQLDFERRTLTVSSGWPAR